MGDPDPPAEPEGVMTPRAVVLVEGDSDRVAVQTLAERLGRDLTGRRIEVVAMGGITNVRAFALRFGPRGLGLPLAGLYDVPEEVKVRRGLVAAGLGAAAGRRPLSELGFYRCCADLEDELIRALGIDKAEAVVAAAGEAQSLRLLRGMPAHRERPPEAVLRRFFGARSGRKARYAALMVQALELDRVPEPLSALLTRTSGL